MTHVKKKKNRVHRYTATNLLFRITCSVRKYQYTFQIKVPTELCHRKSKFEKIAV